MFDLHKFRWTVEPVNKGKWQRADGSWWQSNPQGGDPIPYKPSSGLGGDGGGRDDTSAVSPAGDEPPKSLSSQFKPSVSREGWSEEDIATYEASELRGEPISDAKLFSADQGEMFETNIGDQEQPVMVHFDPEYQSMTVVNEHGEEVFPEGSDLNHIEEEMNRHLDNLVQQREAAEYEADEW